VTAYGLADKAGSGRPAARGAAESSAGVGSIMG
jgi:hypothetical protein